MRYAILFSGVGGQGVLSAAEVAGVVAVNAGFRVRKSEVHGMAQRGGSVESHLVFGDRVFSPLIMTGTADFLVCFDAGEGERIKHFLKPDGVDFSPLLADLPLLPDRRFANTFMLGALSAMLPIDRRFWLEALETVVAKKIPENKKAFALGVQKGSSIGTAMVS